MCTCLSWKRQSSQYRLHIGCLRDCLCYYCVYACVCVCVRVRACVSVRAYFPSKRGIASFLFYLIVFIEEQKSVDLRGKGTPVNQTEYEPTGAALGQGLLILAFCGWSVRFWLRIKRTSHSWLGPAEQDTAFWSLLATDISSQLSPSPRTSYCGRAQQRKVSNKLKLRRERREAIIKKNRVD